MNPTSFQSLQKMKKSAARKSSQQPVDAPVFDVGQNRERLEQSLIKTRLPSRFPSYKMAGSMMVLNNKFSGIISSTLNSKIRLLELR